MSRLISVALFVCTLAAPVVGAQTQGTATTPQDRREQEQAGRDRRQAEREQRERNKDGRKEPGTRCSRWKRGKA